MKMFGLIRKAVEQDDGTVKVYGIASTGNVDDTGETITSAAMKAALPDWVRWGNIREMHGDKAAGTAMDASINDAGEFELSAHIVDPVAVLKVKTGVYKGFSVGGKCTSRDPLNKTIITGLKLVEVSLVDRPANPEAMINLWKALEMPQAETPSVAEPIAIEPAQAIKKSMYQVSNFAGLLSSIGSLAGDAEWEAQYEGDASPVPQQLRDWLAAGAEIFEAMAQEETSELMTSLQATPTKKAAPITDIAKAGARFSKSSKETLSALHKAMKDGDAMLTKLGYADEEDADEEDADEEEAEAKKSASADDIAKAATIAAETDAIAKAAFEADKADSIAKALAPIVAELTIAKARVVELESLPMPAKAILTVVEKSASVAVENAIAPVKKFDGTIDEAATAIKKAMAGQPFIVR